MKDLIELSIALGAIVFAVLAVVLSVAASIGLPLAMIYLIFKIAATL